MKFLTTLLLSLSTVAAADKAHGWGNFKNLVAFGDRYFLLASPFLRTVPDISEVIPTKAV